MRVTIVSIDGDTVRALAERCGLPFVARYAGASPRAGASVDVEVDIGTTLAWGRDIAASDEIVDRLDGTPVGIERVGTLLDAREDGAVLACAGSVLLLDCAGAPLPTGRRVRVTAPVPTLHDVRP